MISFCEALYRPQGPSVPKMATLALVKWTRQLKSDNKFWFNYAIIMIGCRSLHFRARQLMYIV
jgi:hypothetical protein